MWDGDRYAEHLCSKVALLRLYPAIEILVPPKSNIYRNIIFVSELGGQWKSMVIMRTVVELIDEILDDGE